MTEERENIIDSYLAQMLEGYEGTLKNMDEYIDNAKGQLEGAVSQREEVVDKIGELKDLLGLEDEVEADAAVEASDEE
tara:strand:- start:347 stop:580 length:234 start_codon:yes stop_codon:yes gene_type:complete